MPKKINVSFKCQSFHFYTRSMNTKSVAEVVAGELATHVLTQSAFLRSYRLHSKQANKISSQLR